MRRHAVVGLSALPRLRRAAQSHRRQPFGFLRATGRGSPLRGTRNYAEVRLPRTLAFLCSSMLACRPILRFARPRNYAEVRLPHSLAFPCYSVSAARPLPRPGGTQAEGASRRDGADRGVSLKVMRRSAAMNRASDCRPVRLQWSRASAMAKRASLTFRLCSVMHLCADTESCVAKSCSVP